MAKGQLKERDIPCRVCGKRMTRPGLVGHMRVHRKPWWSKSWTSARTLPCPMCPELVDRLAFDGGCLEGTVIWICRGMEHAFEDKESRPDPSLMSILEKAEPV